MVDLVSSTIFHGDGYQDVFARLRDEDPVHLQHHDEFGSFWNVCAYRDIASVQVNHRVFSSQGSIVIEDNDEKFPLPMFIATDDPEHARLRAMVEPVFSSGSCRGFEALVRARTAAVLDALPVDEEVDWVEHVSIELTIQMLATLFGCPLEDRHRLVRWSDVAAAVRGDSTTVSSQAQRQAELMECLAYFDELEKQLGPDDRSLTSVLAQETANGLKPSEKLGNLLLLLVAGNDTTRNSMTGSVLFLDQFPEQFKRLRDDPSLIENMTAEVLRHQSPIAYTRRTSLVDTELGGKMIQTGDKLLLWYVSGNMDKTIFPEPRQFVIDRPNARKHLAFGVGIHRCVGARLALLQLRILWEEILQRFKRIEVVAEPQYVESCFIKGYRSLPVRLHPKSAASKATQREASLVL